MRPFLPSLVPLIASERFARLTRQHPSPRHPSHSDTAGADHRDGQHAPTAATLWLRLCLPAARHRHRVSAAGGSVGGSTQTSLHAAQALTGATATGVPADLKSREVGRRYPGCLNDEEVAAAPRWLAPARMASDRGRSPPSPAPRALKLAPAGAAEGPVGGPSLGSEVWNAKLPPDRTSGGSFVKPDAPLS